MAFAGQARPSPDNDTAPRRIDQLLSRMRGLRLIGNVLHVGTHPDDEDAGLLAFMSRKYGARIVYWSATRGEAGQNRLGPYSGDALGIDRTWESLAARAIDSGESLFGPFYDFGYTTNGAEAATKWSRHELVREIVRAIRLVRPQILIARFAGHASDGHGQHHAIGAATLAAFDAAADPALYPELALPAWRTAKLYQSTGGDCQPGDNNAPGTLRPEFECDGFLRIDRASTIQWLDSPTSRWRGWRSTATRRKPWNPTLPGLVTYPGGGPPDARTQLETICASVDSALLRFRPDDPSAAVAPLLEGLETLRCLRAKVDGVQAMTRQLDDTIAAFEQLIIGCLGVDAECVAERAHVAAGERVRIRGRLWNSRGVDIDDSRLTIRHAHSAVPGVWI